MTIIQQTTSYGGNSISICFYQEVYDYLTTIAFVICLLFRMAHLPSRKNLANESLIEIPLESLDPSNLQ